MRRMTQMFVSLWWTSLLLIGLPASLVGLVGWPLPSHLPTGAEWAAWVQQPLTRTTIIDAAALVAWAMWTILLAVALTTAYRRIASLCRHLPDIRLPGPLQGMSAAMLGTVAVSTAGAGATPAAAHAAVAVAGTADRASPILTSQPGSVEAVSAAPAVAAADPDRLITVQAGGQHYTVTVQPGDTLWEIAGAWLGDPHRWPEIYQLNADRYDARGRMRGGDHIEPAWVLALPDDANPPAGAQPATTSPQQTAPSQSQLPAVPAQPAPSTALAQPTSPPASLPPSSPPTAPPATTLPSTPGDDAVIGPHTPQAPGTASSAVAGTSTASPAGSQSPTSRAGARRPGPAGVSLPGGSWVDLGLATAIAAAAALVWKLRRRRYTPRPPTAQLRLDDPDLAPMPPVVAQVRRRLRRPAPEPDHYLDREDALDDVDDDLDDNDNDVEGHDDDPDDAETEQDLAEPPMPAVPMLANSLSTVWPPAGLGLTGPGGEAAGRGFLAAALAAGGIDDPGARSWVVMPAATAATLLGAAAVNLPDTPRLTVTAGLTEALEILDEQTLHRTRLVYGHEVDNVAALRHADPFEEPLPPIVLIADATAAHERARIAALLVQGQRLDIHGVLLGAWPDGNTVVVSADGTTAPGDGEAARHGSHPADVGRLAVLTPTETTDLLATLAESHTGRPQPTAAARPPTVTLATPVEQTAQPKAAPAHDDEKDESAPGSAAATTGGPPAGGSAPEADAAAAAGDQAAGHVPGDDTQPARRDPDRPVADAGNDAPAADGPGRVTVVVLGSPRIIDADPGEPLRPKALELLVYLAVRGGAASQEAVLDDLLADAPASKAPYRLHTYVYNLRRVLKHTGGPATYLDHPAKRYVLNPAALDVDLWRMRTAIAEAKAATDPAVRVAALRRAVTAYQGPLADGCGYEWAEPYREAVRQQATDATLALAHALTDQPEEALEVLTSAIAHNPYAEQLYQAAMRVHAALDDAEAIGNLKRQLGRRLDDIDAEPSDDTLNLAGQLIALVRQRTRRSGERGGDTP